MIIRISSLVGPISYEIADTPPSESEQDGEPMAVFTLTNTRTKGKVTLALSRDEAEMIWEKTKRLLRK